MKGDAEDVKWARIHSSLSRDLAECTNKLTDKATVKLNEGHNEMVAWHNNDTTDCRLGTRDGHKIFCGCTYVLDKISHAHKA